MAGTTLVEATEMYGLYVAAEKAVLEGQKYTIKDRSLTRADLAEIREGREYWSGMCKRLDRGGGIRVRQTLIRDT